MAEIKIEDLYSKGGVPLQNQVQRNANDIASLKLDVRNTAGTPVLSTAWVQLRTAMWSGYVAADGQLLKRADYPDAWEAIEAGKVPVVSDIDWNTSPANRGCFTDGDGSTTFRVPDYNGVQGGSYGPVYLGGGSATSGTILQDRIQNITGTLGLDARGGSFGAAPTGAFKPGASRNTATGGLASVTGVDFDASLVARTGDTTRPITAEGCWAIKLFGAVQNAGEIDAATLATQLAEAQSKIAELEKYPKVLQMSDIFTPASTWTVNENEIRVVEFPTHYEIQGIFRRSGSPTSNMIGTFKYPVRVTYCPLGVPQGTLSGNVFPYIEPSGDAGMQICSPYIGVTWAMVHMMVLKRT